MGPSVRQQLLRAYGIEALRSVRFWLGLLGAFALGLAGLSVKNSVSNPESWSSAYSALAAAGFMLPYAVWVAAAGLLLLLLCGVLTLLIRMADREL